jgi:hypothetical protein
MVCKAIIASEHYLDITTPRRAMGPRGAHQRRTGGEHASISDLTNSGEEPTYSVG